MGLFDSIKKATGLGLTPDQHFERAYEKGVLLGEEHWPKAIELFEAAACKATEAGDAHLAARASANAELYRFVVHKDVDALRSLRGPLSELEDIEQPGSRSEQWDAAGLLDEVSARLIEVEIETVGKTNHVGRAAAHSAAAEAFKELFGEELRTYTICASDQHVETAQARFFYNARLAAWHQAQVDIGRSPDEAAQHMATAMKFFGQCDDEDWRARSEGWLQRCRTKRHCWLCNREFQGEGRHFYKKSATIAPYVAAIMEQRGEDLSVFDQTMGSIAVCHPCTSGIEGMADVIADRRVSALRRELKPVIDQLQATVATNASHIETLHNRLQKVERAAHTH